MNQAWEYKKIGEVLLVERGGSPRPISKYLTDSDDGLNWIKISDATASEKYIYETKQKILKEGLHKTRVVNEGDFLLSNSMSFGRPYIMKTSGCIHDGWLVLKEKEAGLLDKDFLYHLLGSPYIFAQFDKLAAGSTVRNLNIGLVSSVNIPIPPLKEQKQIVAVLDKAFAAINQAKANVEKNLQNGKDLFQSKLNEIFTQRREGWEAKKLGDLSYVKSGGTPLRSKKEFWDEGYIPWYSSGELNDLFTKESERFITDKGLEGSNTKLFPKGSLLIGMYDTAALKMSIIDRDATFNQAIAGVAPSENLNLLFILHAINAIKPELLKQRRGVRQKNLSLTKIKDIKLYVPHISVQNQVVENLKELHEMVHEASCKYELQLQNLDDLKKSILQEAFAGELI